MLLAIVFLGGALTGLLLSIFAVVAAMILGESDESPSAIGQRQLAARGRIVR